MKAYYMASNHTFASIEIGTRRAMIEDIEALFAHDAYGTLFVRDAMDGTIAALTLHGRPDLTRKQIEQWIDNVKAEDAFERAMSA
jgi:hypothetical protein